MSNDNLKLWDSVKDTDNQYTKPIQIDGKEFTSIDGTYQIMRATEQWGSFGCDWGVRNPVFNNFEMGTSTSVVKKDGKEYTNITKLLMCIYNAELFYPGSNGEGSIFIEASRQITFFNGSADPFYSKSIATDALNKGLSKLGFSSDIYMKIDNNENNYSQGLQSYKDGKLKDFKDPFEGPGINIEEQNKNKKSEDELNIKFKEALDKKDYDEDKKKSLIAETSTFVKKSFIDGTIPEL